VIPGVCKYFKAIISECHTFRSVIVLTPEVMGSEEIFARYCRYIRIEKITISRLVTDIDDQVLENNKFIKLGQLASANNTLKRKIVPSCFDSFLDMEIENVTNLSMQFLPIYLILLRYHLQS
jgi:hypothetical protein